MKARVFFLRAGIALGLLSLGGCVNTPEGWRILSPMRPLPHATVQRWRTPERESEEIQPMPHYAERYVTPPKTQARETAPSTAAAPQAATSSAEAAPPRPASPPAPAQARPVPTVTLADANVSREQVLEMLTQANGKLSRIDRGKLDGNNAATYDQAAAFLQQARKAADQRDYVAASGLAHKASILADKLVSSH